MNYQQYILVWSFLSRDLSKDLLNGHCTAANLANSGLKFLVKGAMRSKWKWPTVAMSIK